jgi:internalin A
MFELSEIWRNSGRDGAAFLQRVRIYVVDRAQVWKPADWITWAAYWKAEYDELNALANKHDAALLGVPGFRHLTLMQRFYTEVSDILGTLADIVQPRTFEDLERYGFDDV